MALPIENRQIAYYTSCALTTLMTYGILQCASIEFIALSNRHFGRVFAYSSCWVGPPKGSTRCLQFKLPNEGTRPCAALPRAQEHSAHRPIHRNGEKLTMAGQDPSRRTEDPPVRRRRRAIS